MGEMLMSLKFAFRSVAALPAAVLAISFAPAASAYVGPGAGLGVLGAILAILAALGATLLGLVLWPLRALKRRRKAQLGEQGATQAGAARTKPSS
jgi:hypothetical protein